MLIASIASGVLGLTNKEIETSIHKFEIDCRFTDATVYTETIADAKAILIAALGSASLTVVRQNNNNTETLQPKILLIELAEMCTNNEGVIRIDRDEAGDTTRIRFTVELSNQGALALDDNSKIIINLEQKVSTSVIDIYAIDYPETGNTKIVYEKKYINANVAADVDTTGTDVIALPIENVSELRLYYRNGKEVVMLQEELKQTMFDSQDPVLILNGRTFFGYVNLALVNVELCWKAKITLDASTNFYVIKTK